MESAALIRGGTWRAGPVARAAAEDGKCEAAPASGEKGRYGVVLGGAGVVACGRGDAWRELEPGPGGGDSDGGGWLVPPWGGRGTLLIPCDGTGDAVVAAGDVSTVTVDASVTKVRRLCRGWPGACDIRI